MLDFLGDKDTSFWIKFSILSVILIVVCFMFAPSFKWKILLSLASMVGVWTSLVGKQMKGFTPYARRYS